MSSRPSHVRRPSRSGLIALGVSALLVIAPVAAFESRGTGAPRTDKADLFTSEVEEAFTTVPASIAAGRSLSEDLVTANGGWRGDEMPWVASGTFTVAPGMVAAPDPSLREVSVLVRTEDGIPVDPVGFADNVMRILNDPRGWGQVDGVSFARTDIDSEADIVLTLASPATTDQLCGELPTNGYTSCGRGRPVNINGDRWVEGAAAFMDAGGTIEEYRTYVINHEFGHSLSHPHERCPGPGELAPVMLQQTLTVDSCVPNGWPNP